MFFPINFSNMHVLIVLSLPHSVKSLKSLSYGIFFFLRNLDYLWVLYKGPTFHSIKIEVSIQF